METNGFKNVDGFKISVAIATFNGEKYLRDQLTSLEKQSRVPDEVVISDDFSSDETLNIIERFAKNAPFKVIWSQNQSRLGFAQNFNLALSKTSGDLVFLCDQDDLWFSNKISHVTQIALENPKKLLIMNDALITNSILRSRGFSILDILKTTENTDRTFVHGCCMALRRELLELVLPIPANSPNHDVWISNIAYRLNKKCISKNILQIYRRHNLNSSNTVNAWVFYLGPVVNYFRFISYFFKLLLFFIARKPKLLSDWCELTNIMMRIEDFQKPLLNISSIELSLLRDALKREITCADKRKEIRALPLLAKASLIKNLFRQGFYNNCNGLKSALRDFLLP